MIIFLYNNGIRKYRLFSKISYSHTRPNHIVISTKPNAYNLQKLSKFKLHNKEKDETVKNKIVYNSVIKTNNTFYGNRKQQIEEDENLTNYKLNGAPVLALKYFTKDYISTTLANNETFPSRQKDSLSEREINLEINFPYKKHDHVEIDSNYASTNDDIDKDDFDSDTCSSFNEIKDISCSRHKKTWMHDYNKFAEVSVRQEDEEETDDEDERTYINYGSADPSIPTSSVPCGGCGAHLHCKDPAIPGYLPKEIFTGLKPQQLRAVVCQRCHFLQQYNTALSVTVDPDTYPKLLSKIKGEKAMVILVVDMTDFPCSIWPGILDIVGRRRPLVVVGNKVDLLQDWSRGMLQRAKQALLAQLPPKANILHTALVSAKTGFGIEDLITALYNIWQYRGDVYLVGCTNVGKSMLFNALLQSDYCRTRAVDLIQRATTAPWPGTTLNLLKFPITRPEGHRLAMRSLRLKQQNMNDLQQIQQGGHHEVTPQMISQINRTFSHGNIESNSDEYSDDLFAMPKLEVLRKIREPGSGLDPSDPMLAKSKWLYDTPGVITSDQIINLLTTEELMLTLPRRPLIPRTFTVWAGQSLMVGGLGRLDYLSGNTNIKMTVLAADTLPVTICFTQDAAEVYSHYLGSAALAVPCGSAERLRLWPGLKSKEEFALKGIGWNESCCDVVLSSAGWVALTAAKDNLVRLQPWTPEGRGAYVRIPPVLPRAICVKGQRMFKSPAYALFNDSIKLRNN